MLKRLSETLKDKLKKNRDLSRQVEIVRVFDIYRVEIKKVFPNEKNITPQTLHHRVLTVKTASPVMANELRMREKEVIEKINATLSQEVVIRVVYKF